MQFTVVIPSIGNKENARRILSAINTQTLQPEKIIFVVRVDIYTDDLGVWLDEVSSGCSQELITKIEIEKIQEANASKARNIGIHHTYTPYIYLIDDDNVFDDEFFARTCQEYQKYTTLYKQGILYSPTIMYRTTNRIQSLGMKTFHFLVGWPEPVQFGGWKNSIVSGLRFLFPLPQIYSNQQDFVRPMLIGGNSLFMNTILAKQNLFDENIPFVYEDLDMVYSVTSKGIPLIVSKTNKISHMERDKTKLELSFLATPEGAYQKAKNRKIFVKKHGNRWQKILFFGGALPDTTIMTLIFIMMHGGRNRWRIARAYIAGIFA